VACRLFVPSTQPIVLGLRLRRGSPWRSDGNERRGGSSFGSLCWSPWNRGSCSPSRRSPIWTAGAGRTANGDRIGLAAGLLDDDLVADVATVLPGTDQLLVLLGRGDGTLATPTAYASGGDQPVSVVVGNFVGDARPDLAVGHQDGSIGFFQGRGGGQFEPRTDLTITLGADHPIVDLTAADLDGDGDEDLVASATREVVVLWNDDDPLPFGPLVNGDFSAGLTGWTPEVIGHAPGTTPGTVQASSGWLQLTEQESFLASASQTFVVPPSPQTLSVDLVAVGLDPVSAAGIPDACELSLLGGDSQPSVPAFGPGATSFFIDLPRHAAREVVDGPLTAPIRETRETSDA
jgi:hypothetical protein